MKKARLFVAMTLAAALFAGCGSSGGNSKTDTTANTSEAAMSMENGEVGEPETTDITFYGVNDLQISAAMMIAENQGYFKEEGLNVECVYMANVPEIAAIMANGEAKIACANNYSTPTWVLNGAKCKVIAPTCNMGGTQCLLLRDGIEIESAKDLEGLTMGMVSGSTQYVTFRNMCK